MSDWHGTGSKVKVLTREFERNHPFGEIYPPRPMADALGRDPLDALLEMAWLTQQHTAAKLRATRDTAAIRASNANTRLLLQSISNR